MLVADSKNRIKNESTIFYEGLNEADWNSKGLGNVLLVTEFSLASGKKAEKCPSNALT